MDFSFLDFHGLTTFFNALKNLFATKEAVQQVEYNTNELIRKLNLLVGKDVFKKAKDVIKNEQRN